MASSGFNQPSPHGEDKANAKARRDEQDDEVMRLLQAITGDSGSAEKATNGIDMSEAMNSRIQVPLDAKLNRERLQTLAEFYEAERALSRAMLAFAGNLRTSHQNSKGEKMYMALRKCAIRELLAKTTHESTQALNLIAIADNRLSAWGVTVFDEVFESSPNPNLAEIEFLARFVGSDDAVVRRWFTSKRDRLLNLFNAKRFLNEFNREGAEKILEMLVKQKAAQDGKGI